MDFLRLTNSSIRNSKASEEDYSVKEETPAQKREADLMKSFFDTVKDAAGKDNAQSSGTTVSFANTAEYINRTQDALSQMQSMLENEDAETETDKTVNNMLNNIHKLYENGDKKTDKALTGDTQSLLSQIKSAASEEENKRAKNTSNTKAAANQNLLSNKDVNTLLSEIKSAASEEENKRAKNTSNTKSRRKSKPFIE